MEFGLAKSLSLHFHRKAIHPKQFFTWITVTQVTCLSGKFDVHANGRINTYLISLWRHQMETFWCYWPFGLDIPRSLSDSPHKGQWCRALKLSLISASWNGSIQWRQTGFHQERTIMNGSKRHNPIEGVSKSWSPDRKLRPIVYPKQNRSNFPIYVSEIWPVINRPLLTFYDFTAAKYE